MKFSRSAGWVIPILFGVSGWVWADQIEKEVQEQRLPAPAAVLVKVNAETKTVEIFRVPTAEPSILNKSSSVKDVEAAIDRIDSPANKIGELKKTKAELDKETSTEACWRGRWWGVGWRWNNWCGYYPSQYNWYNPYDNYPGYFYYNGGYGGGYNPPGPAGGPGTNYNPPGPAGGPGTNYNPPGPAGGPGTNYNPPGPAGGPNYNPPGPAGGPGTGTYNYGWNYRYNGSNYGFYY